MIHAGYLGRRPVVMGKPLSVDLRVRVVGCGASSTDAGSRAKKAGHAAEQHRADVLRRRRAWFAKQTDLDPRRLIFGDETPCPERR
jgi:hypothetical protein